jgi:hypothetical protein
MEIWLLSKVSKPFSSIVLFAFLVHSLLLPLFLLSYLHLPEALNENVFFFFYFQELAKFRFCEIVNSMVFFLRKFVDKKGFLRPISRKSYCTVHSRIFSRKRGTLFSWHNLKFVSGTTLAKILIHTGLKTHTVNQEMKSFFKRVLPTYFLVIHVFIPKQGLEKVLSSVNLPLEP